MEWYCEKHDTWAEIVEDIYDNETKDICQFKRERSCKNCEHGKLRIRSMTFSSGKVDGYYKNY